MVLKSRSKYPNRKKFQDIYLQIETMLHCTNALVSLHPAFPSLLWNLPYRPFHQSACQVTRCCIPQQAMGSCVPPFLLNNWQWSLVKYSLLSYHKLSDPSSMRSFSFFYLLILCPEQDRFTELLNLRDSLYHVSTPELFQILWEIKVSANIWQLLCRV